MKIEEALAVILENQIKLADMIAMVGYQQMPAQIQNESNRLAIKAQEAIEALRSTS